MFDLGISFYLLAVPAVLLTGISKGGFGGALGGIAVPLLALVMPAPRAAAVMLPILCLTDWFGFRVYYRKWDTANLKVMIPSGILGIVLGALTFGFMREAVIRLLVGGIAVLFTLYRWFHPHLRVAVRPSRRKGVFWCGVSGFTSFVAHAGGPPAMMYLLPQRLDKTTYVATSNLFFMIMNAVKLLPYFALGQMTRATLVPSVMLAPLVPLGVWAGVWLNARVNQLWFYRLVQAALMCTGLQLIYQAVRQF